ncbi:hypothetical protein E2C01_063751 [Portunus trituberculatus]|uniref:Uncharacterized protein n=1 Tax=Portunus trituberculatus TaxID=210409 RepID=A0A5B7HJ03_PORTR|nr:hypothetical protein [Portunus trituberculatus]
MAGRGKPAGHVHASSLPRTGPRLQEHQALVVRINEVLAVSHTTPLKDKEIGVGGVASVPSVSVPVSQCPTLQH